MPIRSISIAALLFSFAVILLGFQPKPDTHIIFDMSLTLPVQVYWVLGTFSIAGSAFFIVVGFRRKWREPVERFMTGHYAYYPASVVFWGVYTISWLKGISNVASISEPNSWIFQLVLYYGFILFICIPIMSFKEWPPKPKKRSSKPIKAHSSINRNTPKNTT